MTVSLKKMSAGDGYRYLLRTVVAGDGDRALSSPLTRYYAEAGTPPGRWIGSGVASLDRSIRVGDEVSEDQLRLLIGQGRHPVTGEPLGRPYRTFRDQGEGARRQPVAGYDLTFSVPKSVSVLWAVADTETQAVIAAAHHAAVADVLDFLEREVLATRAGAKSASGAVAQYDVTGLIAAAFDHYDSRANDPHLHTHVVISNRVKTTGDGAWRTLDGAPAARLGGGTVRAPPGAGQRPPHPRPRCRVGAPAAGSGPQPRLGNHRRPAGAGASSSPAAPGRSRPRPTGSSQTTSPSTGAGPGRRRS